MTLKSYNFFGLAVCFLFSMSCQKKEQIVRPDDSISKQNNMFGELSKMWIFEPKALTPEAQNYLNEWEEWRVFNEEIKNKPVATVSAFQLKSKQLTEKVLALENNLPAFYQKSEIISRLKVFLTHFQSLDMYLHLNDIPVKKVKYYLTEINKTWQSLADKMNELQYKSVIPKEEGEALMMMQNDTINQKTLELSK